MCVSVYPQLDKLGEREKKREREREGGREGGRVREREREIINSTTHCCTSCLYFFTSLTSNNLADGVSLLYLSSAVEQASMYACAITVRQESTVADL